MPSILTAGTLLDEDNENQIFSQAASSAAAVQCGWDGLHGASAVGCEVS